MYRCMLKSILLCGVKINVKINVIFVFVCFILLMRGVWGLKGWWCRHVSGVACFCPKFLEC